MTLVGGVLWWVFGFVCGVIALVRGIPHLVLMAQRELELIASHHDQLRRSVDELGATLDAQHEQLEVQRRIYDEDTARLVELYREWPGEAELETTTRLEEAARELAFAEVCVWVGAQELFTMQEVVAGRVHESQEYVNGQRRAFEMTLAAVSAAQQGHGFTMPPLERDEVTDDR